MGTNIAVASYHSHSSVTSIQKWVKTNAESLNWVDSEEDISQENFQFENDDFEELDLLYESVNLLYVFCRYTLLASKKNESVHFPFLSRGYNVPRWLWTRQIIL